MAQRRHLSRAPIREAIIDLKVSPSGEISKLEQLCISLADRFPVQEEIRDTTFGFEFGPDGFKQKSVEGAVSRGRRLTSKDTRNIVQFRVDGFTFSRLPPYETWEEMSAIARPLWESYLEYSPAEKVTRAAVRYINLMGLPLPIGDFGEYLSSPPEVPTALPQEIAGFFSRVVLTHREMEVVAFVTQALETSVGENAQVILDIDVFREAKDRDWNCRDLSVWTTLEQMRNFKNLIFFESITEKTAELFT